MKELPYFKWYPADAEMDAKYRAMDDSEKGFYLTCLNYSWINGGLPSDATERARVLGRVKREADKRWLRVGKCFEPRDGHPDQLVNPRQERERAAAIAKSDKARESVGLRRDREQQPTNVDTNGLRKSYERKSNVDTNALLGCKASVPLRAFTRAESDPVYESVSALDFDSKKKPNVAIPQETEPLQISAPQPALALLPDPGKQAADKPKKPDFQPFTEGEFDFDVWFDRQYLRHPRKGNRGMALNYLTQVVFREVRPEEFERVHLLWCACEAWTDGGGKFVTQDLAQWVLDKGWKYPPPNSRPAPAARPNAEAQHKQRMLDKAREMGI